MFNCVFLQPIVNLCCVMRYIMLAHIAAADYESSCMENTDTHLRCSIPTCYNFSVNIVTIRINGLFFCAGGLPVFAIVMW